MSPAANSSMPPLPSTPRLKPVELPENLLEDQIYILNATRSTQTSAEGNSLGLLGIITPTITPFVEDVTGEASGSVF